MAAGGTDLTIHYLSNEYSWSNTFNVTLGNGSNVVYIDPVTSSEAALVPTLQPTAFNTEPQKTHLNLVVGDGRNNIITREASSDIHLGRGIDTVAVTDGHNEIWLGDGTDSLDVLSNPFGQMLSPGPIATDRGSDVVHVGNGQGQVVVDDTNPDFMADTTIIVPKTLTPTATFAVRYGHNAAYPSTAFIDGDWKHVTIELLDFAPGSSISLSPRDGDTALVVTDHIDHTMRQIWLQGQTPTLAMAMAHLHIVFGHG